jgi:hypothetical protein
MLLGQLCLSLMIFPVSFSNFSSLWLYISFLWYQTLVSLDLCPILFRFFLRAMFIPFVPAFSSSLPGPSPAIFDRNLLSHSSLSPLVSLGEQMTSKCSFAPSPLPPSRNNLFIPVSSVSSHFLWVQGEAVDNTSKKRTSWERSRKTKKLGEREGMRI